MNHEVLGATPQLTCWPGKCKFDWDVGQLQKWLKIGRRTSVHPLRVACFSGLKGRPSGEKQTSWFAVSRQLKSPRGTEGFAGKFSHKSFNPPNYTNMIFTLWLMGKDDLGFLNFIFSQGKNGFCFLNFIFSAQKKWLLLCEFRFSWQYCQAAVSFAKARSASADSFLHMPHVVFGSCFFLLVCLCLSQALFVVLVLCLLFLLFSCRSCSLVCCSCSFVCCSCSLFVVLALCLLFLFFVCCSCWLFFLFGGLFCSPNGCG